MASIVFAELESFKTYICKKSGIVEVIIQYEETIEVSCSNYLLGCPNLIAKFEINNLETLVKKGITHIKYQDNDVSCEEIKKK